MVTTCPDDAHPEDIKMCMNRSENVFKLSLPVLGKDNIVYKNQFCARCNGIVNFKAISMKVSNISKMFLLLLIFKEGILCYPFIVVVCIILIHTNPELNNFLE